MTVGIDDIEAARQRLAPVLKRTPLQYSATLSRMLDAEVLVKPENLQKTGSFKIRGAYNRVMALARNRRAAAWSLRRPGIMARRSPTRQRRRA